MLIHLHTQWAIESNERLINSGADSLGAAVFTATATRTENDASYFYDV